ncbi:MAG: potassium channel family protein [Anaerovoracaceae bacterium]|jgi:trk system potassium uptake protein TrkA
MKSILLIGLGRFGRNVAHELSTMDHEVLAVDHTEKRVNDVMNFVTDAKIGDSTDREFLETLGVSNFDCCIVCIGDSFRDSLVTTDLLKTLGAKFVASRATSAIHAKFLKKLGADEVIYPERIIGEKTAIRYGCDHVLEYTALSQKYALYELEIPEKWIGKTIGSLELREKYDIRVIAIRRGGELDIDITPDDRLETDSTLVVLGEHEPVRKCFDL